MKAVRIEKNAKEAAEAGNKLKTYLGWPENLCKSKPIKRICQNCEYWQADYHTPGAVWQDTTKGKCMFGIQPVVRYEDDRACNNFEPKI